VQERRIYRPPLFFNVKNCKLLKMVDMRCFFTGFFLCTGLATLVGFFGVV
jgi:hypothetical protein